MTAVAVAADDVNRRRGGGVSIALRVGPQDKFLVLSYIGSHLGLENEFIGRQRTHTHTHTHTHTRAHAHAPAHTHTRARARISARMRQFVSYVN